MNITRTPTMQFRWKEVEETESPCAIKQIWISENKYKQKYYKLQQLFTEQGIDRIKNEVYYNEVWEDIEIGE